MKFEEKFNTNPEEQRLAAESMKHEFVVKNKFEDLSPEDQEIIIDRCTWDPEFDAYYKKLSEIAEIEERSLQSDSIAEKNVEESPEYKMLEYELAGLARESITISKKLNAYKKKAKIALQKFNANQALDEATEVTQTKEEIEELEDTDKVIRERILQIKNEQQKIMGEVRKRFNHKNTFDPGLN